MDTEKTVRETGTSHSEATIRERNNDEPPTLREDANLVSNETIPEGENRTTPHSSMTIDSFRGYDIAESLPASGGESDSYVIEKNGEQFFLKLYRNGIVPKNEVQSKIAQISQSETSSLVRIIECGYDKTAKRWFEIQEFVELGSLSNFIENRSKLGEGQKTLFEDVVREVSEGLKFLHDNGLLHRDIKPSNILVRSVSPLQLAIVDFGISSNIDPEQSQKLTGMRGTPIYQSPESLTGSEGKVITGKASDWWGLGVILLDIVCGQNPFSGLSHHVILNTLATRPMPIPKELSDEKRLILEGLLTRDMSKRWGYDQVSRWLAGERDIPAYFEKSVVEGKSKPFVFHREKYYSLETIAAAFVKDETSWSKGKTFLMRGNINKWLENNNEFEVSVELETLLKNTDDPDEKLFKFVHFYGKQLPFVFMGKAVTLNNIYLFLAQHVRRESLGEATRTIAIKFLDGSLSKLIDFYMEHNGQGDEIKELKAITYFPKKFSIDVVVAFLDMMVNKGSLSKKEYEALLSGNTHGCDEIIHKKLWGYDDKNVAIIDEISNKIAAATKNTDVDFTKYALLDSYVAPLRKRKRKLFDEDIELIKKLSKSRFNEESMMLVASKSSQKRLAINYNEALKRAKALEEQERIQREKVRERRMGKIVVVLVCSILIIIFVNKLNEPNFIATVRSGDQKTVAEFLNVYKEHDSALFAAAQYNKYPEVINVIIEAGANVNMKDADGNTPVMLAAQYNSGAVVSALIKAGANVNEKNKEEMTALKMAATNSSDPEVIRVLANAGADKYKRCDSLMYAAINNPNPDIIKALIRAGADVNGIEVVSGVTALILAAKCSSNAEILKVLLDAGADAKIEDKDGKTAIDYAQENKKLDKSAHGYKALEEASKAWYQFW